MTLIDLQAGLVETPTGKVEFLRQGSGAPITVVGHGLTRNIADTRLLVRGAPGTTTFFHFRGHGRSSMPPGAWTYGALADEFRAVADHVGARAAVAVSVSCGVLAHLALNDPGRFDRLVLVLPPPTFGKAELAREDVIHEYLALAAAGRAGDLATLINAAWPAWMRAFDETGALGRGMAEHLVGQPTVVDRVRALVREQAVPDERSLSAIRSPTLVIGQAGDRLHPLAAAEGLAAALPRGRLLVLEPVRSYWAYGKAVSAAVAAFLREEA